MRKATRSRLPAGAALRAVGALAGLTGLAAPARAGGGVVVVVDCAVLGAEPHAALESRAKAELFVRQREGTLVISCREGAARLTWHSVTGAAEAVIALGADEQTSVERALDALDSLLRVPAAPPAGSAGGAAGLPLAPPTDLAAPQKPATNGALPVEAERDPGESRDPGDSRDSTGAGRRYGRGPPDSRDPGGWGGPSAAVGVGGELWSASVGAALGPMARFEFVARSGRGGVLFEGGGALFRTWNTPEGVAGRLARVHLGGGYVFGGADGAGRLRAGARLFVDQLHVATTPKEGAPGVAAADDVLVGAEIHAGYALFSPPFRVLVGLRLAAHRGAARVEFGDHEVFRIPLVVIGFGIEGLFGPF